MEMRRKTTVPAAIMGTPTRAMSDSGMLVTASNMRMPTRVVIATTAEVNPDCRKPLRASMSVVMRVMIVPVLVASK